MHLDSQPEPRNILHFVPGQNQAAVGRDSSRDESYLQGTILTECTHTRGMVVGFSMGRGVGHEEEWFGPGGSLSKSVKF